MHQVVFVRLAHVWVILVNELHQTTIRGALHPLLLLNSLTLLFLVLLFLFLLLLLLVGLVGGLFLELLFSRLVEHELWYIHISLLLFPLLL